MNGPRRFCSTKSATWEFQISAWDDEYHTWLHNAEVKLAASVDEELMMLEGEKLLKRLAESAKGKDKKALTDFAKQLVTSGSTPGERLTAALAAGLSNIADRNPLRNLETLSDSRISALRAPSCRIRCLV